MKPKSIALQEIDGALRIMLVYQAGIANVFHVASFNLAEHGRDARRIYQGDYRTAESICYGMGLAGAVVRSAGCNEAGDIANRKWSDDLESRWDIDIQEWN